MSMPVVGLPGMVVIAGKMTTLGWEMIVVYTAVISFSMGIVNLLPISVIDGGQAVMLASRPNAASGIAVDATSVYWGSYFIDTQEAINGAVMKLTPK